MTGLRKTFYMAYGHRRVRRERIARMKAEAEREGRALTGDELRKIDQLEEAIARDAQRLRALGRDPDDDPWA